MNCMSHNFQLMRLRKCTNRESFVLLQKLLQQKWKQRKLNFFFYSNYFCVVFSTQANLYNCYECKLVRTPESMLLFSRKIRIKTTLIAIFQCFCIFYLFYYKYSWDRENFRKITCATTTVVQSIRKRKVFIVLCGEGLSTRQCSTEIFAKYFISRQ